MFTICCQTKHLRAWARDFGVDYKSLHSRLRYTNDLIESLHLGGSECPRLRKGIVFELGGVRKTLSAWVKSDSVLAYGTVQQRIYAGWSLEQALASPIGTKLSNLNKHLD